ncbi:MAG: hypothetical protein ACFE0Q_03715 [Anaerolineae bacterium]
MRLHHLLLWLMMVIVLMACTPSPNLRDETFLDDTSLISGDPCEAPCWQNMIPGETLWGVAQETLTTLEGYVEVDNQVIRRTGEAWIEFAFQDGLKCCRIYSADGETLTSILLLLSPQMQVADVIERFGEPRYMTAQAETSDQAYVALLYPDTPMLIYAFAENITDSEINGDNDVIGLVYMSTQEMETLLQMQNLYDWNGYGVLGDMLDGIFDVTPVPQTES